VQTAGGATAVAAGSAAAGSAAAQQVADGGTIEVTVGPGGSLAFEPAELQVTPGTTVAWTWDSDNHNVVPDSIPDDAEWGGEGEEGTTFDSGHEYEHTFETLGTYEYVCTPHASAGMAGSVEVVEEVSTPEPVQGPSVPDSAKTLGVATTVAMVATLGLGVYADATEEERWPYPTSDQLATDYDAHAGDQALVFGTVEERTGDTARIEVEYDTGTFQLTVRNFDATVQPGGTVQVYGTLERDRTMTAERVVVVNPAGSSVLFKYAVSLVAAVLFLVVFFRYWRLDWQTLTVEERDG